jgi:predicted acylesterase/phospholipase RssA/CRP-like cAMP-binding protein
MGEQDRLSNPQLVQFLGTSRFFGDVPQTTLQLLAPHLAHIHVSANERLIRQGEQGDRLYVVIRGRLRVTDEKSGEQARTLTFKGPGDGVGEIALLSDESRTASVYAAEDAYLVSLSRHSLEELSDTAPQAVQPIYRAIRHHINQTRLKHALHLAEVFRKLDEAVLDDLQSELEFITIASGETLIHKGDPGDALYIVISGRLRVTLAELGHDGLPYVDIHHGQTVGEISLITGEERTADVYAVRDTLLARLSQTNFNRLLEKYPQELTAHFAGPIIDALRTQLAGGYRQTSTVTTIALVPVNPEVALSDFSTRLTAAVAKLGPAQHLSSERCDSILNSQGLAQSTPSDPGYSRLLLWLNEQEAHFDFVLLEADASPSPWTRRCLHQADLIVLVGNAQGAPELGQIEQTWLAKSNLQHTTTYLVLLHEESTALPHGTTAWLASRVVDMPYHVRLRHHADFNRLARLLCGRGVGLVLSGGGARAFAQVGVIRALVENGIPIDVIGGVSGGALVAALWAMGLDPATIIRRGQAAANRVDYTLPFHALTTGHNWTKSMKTLFGEVLIEDLWLSFFCISTNLSQASLTVHQQGGLMHAVRASTAIPGILTPVAHEGDVLVDGGLINNLPADLMTARPDVGCTLAVDVSAAGRSKVVSDFDYGISGWKSLWHRLNPLATKPDIPSIGEILLGSITFTNAQSANLTRKMVDLYLNPPVQQFGLLDFDEMDSLADIGYQYTQETLAAGIAANATPFSRVVGLGSDISHLSDRSFTA